MLFRVLNLRDTLDADRKADVAQLLLKPHGLPARVTLADDCEAALLAALDRSTRLSRVDPESRRQSPCNLNLGKRLRVLLIFSFIRQLRREKDDGPLPVTLNFVVRSLPFGAACAGTR